MRQPIRTRYLVAAATGIVAVAAIGLAQSTTGPVARYEMRAGTASGFGGMAAGGKPGMGSAMSMAFGGGRSSAQHELWLDLGSSRAASAAPKADHFMPAGMKLGVSVPLHTPEKGPVGPSEPVEQGKFERPKGRMLIFWGCGEHAPKGQPVIIDFAKIAAGQMPPGLWTTSVPSDRFVSRASSKTYGYWPWGDGKQVKPDGSLLGQHRVAGNYSPEMSFTLTHDFMGALHAGSAPQPSGATLLRWNPLGDATGYHASLIGGKGDGREMQDIVWWSSSLTREFGGGLVDWLSPATVARLVANKTVLSPQTTTCMIPAEVKQAAAQFMMVSLYAYGPEEDFVYPPKPTNPKAVWNIEWQARIRHRSMTSIMPGMPGMDEMGDTRQQNSQQQCPPKKKRGFGGLGGLIGGALGVPGSDDGC